MPFSLLISDLDGTILETEDYHRRAYNLLFKKLDFSVVWTKQDYIDRLGVMGGSKLREVFSWMNLPETQYFKVRNNLYQQKTKLYLELINKDLNHGNLSLRPGIRRLFGEVKDAGIPIAIGSACEKAAAKEVLRAAFGDDFTESFAAICAGEDVSRKKPDPSIYLLAAEHAGVPPSECVVIEDTGHGMRAALGAGMKCLVTPSEYALDHDFSEATCKRINLDDPSPLGLADLKLMLENH